MPASPESTKEGTPKYTFTDRGTTVDVGSLEPEVFYGEYNPRDWKIIPDENGEPIFAYRVEMKEMAGHKGSDVMLLIFFPIILTDPEQLTEAGMAKVKKFQQWLKNEMATVRRQNVQARARDTSAPALIDIQIPPTPKMLEELQEMLRKQIDFGAVGTAIGAVQEPLKSWFNTTYGPETWKNK